MEKNRYRLAMIMFLIFALACGCVSAAVAIKTSVSVPGTVKTGGIDIDVKTYMESGGELTPMQDKTVVDYYGDVSYIPIIENKAEEAYIRVELKAETEAQDIDLVKEIYGIDDESWKKTGSYFYYTKPLKTDETVDFCEGFSVPEAWDYMMANNMKVRLYVDAVQAKNFEPDFTAENPWGDVAISESKIAGDYTVTGMDPVEARGNIRVVYQSGASGITINKDELFSNVKFMPGDKYSDSIKITNSSSEKTTILFKAEHENDPLLDEMRLAIDSVRFYSGPMSGKELSEYKQIAVLDPGQTKNIDISLELPVETGNVYQVEDGDVTWCFAVQQNAVKTGNSFPFWILAGICFASAAAAVIVFWRKKHESI